MLVRSGGDASASGAVEHGEEVQSGIEGDDVPGRVVGVVAWE
jgi:hypothetical protein